MAADNVEVSVVLPAYNEAAILEDTVERTLEALEAFSQPAAYEVLVAENGSTDGTLELARGLSQAHERVRVVSVPEAGRGRALNVAFEDARGDVLVYFDVDLATDLSHLEQLVDAIRHEGYDVATGSRWMPGHEADRPSKRAIPSKGFNWMARTFLGSKLRDHQCGFKALDRDAFDALAADLPDDNWFWDTQLLVLAQDRGYEVQEFPVDWTPKGDSKLSLGRDIVGMGAKAAGLWWRMHAPRWLRRNAVLLVTWLVVLAALAGAVAYVDAERVLTTVRGAELSLVGVGVGTFLVSVPLRGLRFQRLLGDVGPRIEAWFATAAVCISQTANLVAPARSGDAVRAYVVNRLRGVEYPSGFAAIVADRVSDVLALAVLAAAMLVVGPATGLFGTELLGELLAGGGRPVLRQGLYAAGVLLGGALIALAAGLAWRASDRGIPAPVRRGWHALAERVPGGRHLAAFGADLLRTGSSWSSILVVGGLAAAIWTLESLTAFAVLAAVGLPASLSLLGITALAVSLANLSKVLPLTPGGIGLYEGVFTLVVATLTPAEWPVALAAAIVDHALKNGVNVAAGLVSAAAVNLSIGEALDRAEAEPAEPETRGECA